MRKLNNKRGRSKYSLQRDKYALKGLLSSLLKISPEEITDITIRNPIEPGEKIDDKDCILDIKLEVNHNRLINIEIQANYQVFYPERSLVYLCRNYNHLKEGDVCLSHISEATEEDKKDTNGIFYWAKMFAAKTWEELMEVAVNNPMMESLAGTIKMITEDEKVALACQARMDYRMDIASYKRALQDAKEEAKKEAKNNM